MQHRRLNIVTDGGWGSCGKGAIASFLAYEHRPEIISTTNAANAGHTAVNTDGSKFIAKALPSPTILTKWYPDYKPLIVIGASAAFTLNQLLAEIEETGIANVMIHPRAGVITEQHKQREMSGDSSTKHIASTMQGCGAFLADKVLRLKELKLARDYPELSKYVYHADTGEGMHNHLHALLYNNTILHEGSQGFSLDINHGSHYPACTSRGTTAIQNLADLGLPPSSLGDIYLVIRPYPIRVGNVCEDGKITGYSGDCYNDQEEITWGQVASEAGAPIEVTQGELTTVTKRLRRVFTFSKLQLKEAVIANGATKIALNFANYLDWSCYGTNNPAKLSKKITDFIRDIEETVSIPVDIVGTGPQLDHIFHV